MVKSPISLTRRGKFILLAVFVVSALAPFFTSDSRVPSSLPNPGVLPQSPHADGVQNGFSDSVDDKSRHSGSAKTPSKDSTVKEDGLRDAVGCQVDLDFLRLYSPEDSVQYTRWEIDVVRSNKFTSFSEKLDLPPPSTDYTLLHLNGESQHMTLPKGRCGSKITIQAPVPAPKPDASHLIFGVATTLGRLSDSIEPFAQWAGGTKARLIAVVEDDGVVEKKSILQRAADLDVRLTILESDAEYLDRYFSLTQVLLQNMESSTKWAVLIDDDTFFPSMSQLVDRLATYDASKPYYVGAVTEDLSQMASFGYVGYGGAGIFLSAPLLQEMNQFYDDCYTYEDTGDIRVARCIYLHTTTKLTWDRRLFQMDLHSDASGFYESGRQLPLSIHHWRTPEWYPVDVVAMSKAARICGDDCQLQRWHLGGSWYLVNGFAVVQYSEPLQGMDLIAMEQTWELTEWSREDDYAFSLGPLRPMDPGKVLFRLQRAVLEGPNRLRQIYMRESISDDGPTQVVEVIWTDVSKGR
ncbi:uncharacterized protein N7459_004139 [Penicillium hispanicum]|uniref:uncharacterized protein n=1 Tax=Penicillium hispanicum TaxID=1080232 RepID=UPI002541420D|nr:uncharacterized protein N7459_004139 [Penicillium hispanicum]KAJ5584339.1 hypothetical protein N7459_004139 [Penicillium hispanicum]